MDKEYINNSIKYTKDEIERLSYLNDEEELNRYIAQWKEKKKKEIQKVQRTSIEELVQEELVSIIKDIPNYLDWIDDIKQEILQDKNPEERYDEYLTNEELIELPIEELKILYQNRFLAGCREMLHSHFSELKDSYDGVTPSELDEYINLLAQKEILADKIDLKRAEISNEVLKTSPRKYDEYFSLSIGEYDFPVVTSIREIDRFNEIKKEKRKEALSNFTKFAKVFGVSSAALSGILTAAIGGGALAVLATGLAVPAAVIGLAGGLMGSAWLYQLKQNNKVIKRLHETGLYDLFVEAAQAEDKVEKFESSRGM